MFLFEKNDIVCKKEQALEGCISNQFIFNNRILCCVEYAANKHEWIPQEELLLVVIIIDFATIVYWILHNFSNV